MCTTILPDLTAFIAALLFAVHPIHTEAVSIVLCHVFALPTASASSHVTNNLIRRLLKSWKFNLRIPSSKFSLPPLDALPPEKNVLGMLTFHSLLQLTHFSFSPHTLCPPFPLLCFDVERHCVSTCNGKKIVKVKLRWKCFFFNKS